MSDLKKENKNLYTQVTALNERVKTLESEIIGL